MTRIGSDGLTRAWSRWALLGFGAIGVLSLGVLEASNRRTGRTLQQVVVATDNLMAARLAIARAHLAWERIEEGDPTFEQSRPAAELATASGLLSDLVEGRSNLITFGASAFDDPGVGEAASRLAEDVSELRRALVSNESGFLDAVELRVRFTALDDGATQLHYDLQEVLSDRLTTERRWHLGLLASWTLFLLLVGGGLWKLRQAAEEARTAAEQAGRERASVEARLDNLRALIDAGVVRTEPDGRLVEATRWWRTLGIDEGEATGRPWWELLMPDDRDRARAAWQANEPMRAPFTIEARVQTASGAERWLAARWRPVEAGRLAPAEGWVGTFVDVTDQRSLEAQLRQAQKLEAVGQMTGSLTHDFNNLLMVVLMNVELLRLEHAAIPASAGDLLDGIQQAARNGKEMIARLMSFSRRSELSIESVNLSILVRDGMKLGQRLLPNDVHVTVSLLDAGPIVMADPHSIQQALLNLVSNARDAMPEGGQLVVEVEGVEVREESTVFEPWVAAGSYGRISVSDTGVGMDQETLSRIFEPFFSTKGEGRGTGLGLSSVHGIVRQHGGHIHAYSEPGRGTTFRIYLPAAPPRAEPAQAQPDSQRERMSRPEASLRVLLVEDDQRLRRAARLALARLGHQVEVAESGLQALEALSQPDATFDLIISDIFMQGMDGIELYRRLRGRGVTVPFLFTSGRSEAQAVEDGDGVPVDAMFLAKPWTIPDLEAAIERTIATAA